MQHSFFASRELAIPAAALPADRSHVRHALHDHDPDGHLMGLSLGRPRLDVHFLRDVHPLQQQVRELPCRRGHYAATSGSGGPPPTSPCPSGGREGPAPSPPSSFATARSPRGERPQWSSPRSHSPAPL